MAETPIHTQKWLERAGVGFDRDVIDRVADIVIDGMTASGGGVAGLPSRILVLVRVMAMMIAAMRTAKDPALDQIVQGLYANLGGAVEAEVEHFIVAAAKDERRAERAHRSVFGGR